MMKEMITFNPASNPGLDAQTGSGLGLMSFEMDGQELIGHVGEFMGSTSIAMYAPDKGYTIVVTCNLSYPDLTTVVANLQKIVQ